MKKKTKLDPKKTFVVTTPATRQLPKMRIPPITISIDGDGQSFFDAVHIVNAADKRELKAKLEALGEFINGTRDPLSGTFVVYIGVRRKS